LLISGSLPNSNRKIEPELIRRLMFDNQIKSIISSCVEVKGLELLNYQRSIESFSAPDKFSSEELQRFWLVSRDIQESMITGSETFLGEMLRPIFNDVIISSDMLDLIVKYYTVTYEMFEFWKPFGEGAEDSIIISVKMNQFERCRIGSEIFGSLISLRHVKSSYILAKFITNDMEIECYPSQVQYYFTHVVDFPDGPIEHFLAFVR
jgi:hypothetical protein